MRILITNLLKQNSNNRITTQHKNNSKVYFGKQEQPCSFQGTYEYYSQEQL